MTSENSFAHPKDKFAREGIDVKNLGNNFVSVCGRPQLIIDQICTYLGQTIAYT